MTFIGPKPTDGPKYCTPFEAGDGCQIVDARGVYVARVSISDSGYKDDREMAQAIADALNEKFGEGPKKATVTAEVFSPPGGGDPDIKRDVWLVVDGKAYFQNDDGSFETSFYTPGEIRTDEDFQRLGTREIDPAVLVGIRGKE